MRAQPPATGAAAALEEQPVRPRVPSALEERGDDGSDAGENPFRLRARLIGGFEHERERPAGEQTRQPDSEYGFVLRQVRLNLRAELAELFRLRVSFDLADALSPEVGGAYTSPEYIRTASVEYRPSRAFRLEIGRFKRPFSRLELESVSDLPILGRGLFNDLGIEENQWGDRALGAMASGRVKALNLRWYLSAMNPGWSSVDDRPGVDVIGRVEVKITKALGVGAGGGYKYLRVGDEPLHNWGVGADLALEVAGLHVLLEALSLDLPYSRQRPRGFGVVALFDYRIDLSSDWALQPTLSAEIADAHATFSQTESLRLVLGVNALGYDGFRLMPQVALVRSIGDTSSLNPWPESETYNLVLSLVL